jgi:hypothetical protein
MNAKLVDTALWLSRRLRYVVLALLAVGALKTAAAALESPTPASGAQAEITQSGAVVSQ